jgi:hypothetical protein
MFVVSCVCSRERQKYKNVSGAGPQTLLSSLQNTYVLGWWIRDESGSRTKPSERIIRVRELNILPCLKCNTPPPPPPNPVDTYFG